MFVLDASAAFRATTTGYTYIPTGINVTGKQSLVLQVRSNDNAQVAIVTTPGDYYNDTFEIVFRSLPGRYTFAK